MLHSQLAVVGLDICLNKLLNPDHFSALIYQGLNINNSEKLRDDSWSILSNLSHQAVQNSSDQLGKKVALIVANNQSNTNNNDAQFKHLLDNLSNLWDCSITPFQLNHQTDCLLKALEIAEILLVAKEVDTVIISAVNTTLSSQKISGGSIVLKHSEATQADNSHIYAIIESFTKITDSLEPSSIAIQESCEAALNNAKIHPENVGYLEVSRGRIQADNNYEVQGLTKVYPLEKAGLSCAVGTTQDSINSLGITQGLISLIKTSLCLDHRYLPPTPQEENTSPKLWENSAFYLPQVASPWFLEKGQKKRHAAVNIVTNHGTYGHITLSEATPKKSSHHHYLPHASFYLFPLAAEDLSSLQQQLDSLSQTIEYSLSLPQVAQEIFKQFKHRSQFPYVVTIVGDKKETLQKEIKQAKKGIEKAFTQGKRWKSPKGSYFTPKPLGKQGKIAFVYPGAFNSYLGMGRNLFQLFPKLWDRMNSFVSDPGGFFQAKYLYPRSQYPLSKRDIETLETNFMANPLSLLETGIGFAVLFTEIMQQYFRVKPEISFGYSMGETTMMYALGVWPNADQGSDFVHSSPLFKTRLLGEKKVVSDYWQQTGDNLWSSHVLMATPEQVKQCLQTEKRVYLTHINTPQEVVIAGDPQGCLRVIDRLECDGFRSPSDMVLHCEAMQSEYPALRQLNTVGLGTIPKTVFYSSANYEPISLEQQAIAHHLSQGVCQQLDFPRLVNRTYEDGARIFLELGSGGSCSRWISETLQERDHLALCINRRGADDLASIVKMLAQLVSHKVEVDISSLYLRETIETTPETKPIQPQKTVTSLEKVSQPCLYDEADILEFVEGKVAKVFGKDYEPIDQCSRRVRMPSPPFLFVSRVTKLEGTLGQYGSGLIETEYDIPDDAWYAIDGQLTVGICKEAGHGLLMLLSYLGTDFESLGKRSFRLLDLSATFLFEQPENLKELKCRVKITSSVKTENSLLVFFQGEGLIDDKVWMKLDNGCAGIFSDEELAEGQGIVESESEAKEHSQIQKQQFTPLLTCPKNSFNKTDILALSQGDLTTCFGENYGQHGLNPSLRLPPEKLVMLDEVMMIDPQGGIAGLGLAIGSKQITPDDWYYNCHFRNDPTLPGNLMIEGSIQLVHLYSLFLGLQTKTKDARFQIIPGKTQAARFRGQVVPQFGTLMYQMEVLEIGLSPQPYIIANVAVIFGGKTIATIKNIGFQLLEKPVTIKSNSLNQNTKSVLFNENQLKAFAKGSVASCLGSEFSIYENRQSVRLPNGEFQLVSRVLDIEGKRHELNKPSSIVTEFDVAENAWFYEHNSYPRLPYCTYIEIAGQPCIFQGVYMGATLLSPDDDLHFRNLDGQGIVLKEMDLRNKTITDHVKLVSTTSVKGAIIQKFEFELSCEGDPFYRGNMVFGDFSTPVLANQVGLDGGKRLKPWYENNELSGLKVKQISLKEAHSREKFYKINPQKPHYRLSQNYLDFLDEVYIIEKGGNYQQGYLYATKTITPEDWYFPYHFYQDPVMPGALGVEAILQGMQTYALELDLGKSFKNPRFGQAINHQITWKYRGQITPENRFMSLEVHISQVKQDGDRLTIIGDASLWKEGLRIYEIKNIALCLLEA
ncbi:short-chain dehydrogenase [Crocosphaera sp.]|uniref:short-chain dehydrogenase n=1 Tax=Crocosphaera sp. TaxID=2729996 RepID=UPI003F2453BA|nr:short-chain dehydrogenase [Crocosphaera sp.]